LPVFQPEKIKECEKIITDLNADIMVVVAFGQILPQNILDIPRLGCLNIHASLLPSVGEGQHPFKERFWQGIKPQAWGLCRWTRGLIQGKFYLKKLVR
jgi:methionyl-tRNA formyltransferase